MKKYLKFIFKGFGWLVLAASLPLMQLFMAVLSRDGDEHPLGDGYFLRAIFNNPVTYEVALSSNKVTFDNLLPQEHSVLEKSVSGSMPETVRYVVRYPRFLAVSVYNRKTDSCKYYLIDKDSLNKTRTLQQPRKYMIVETDDSTSFIRICEQFNLRGPYFPSDCPVR